MPNCRDSVSGCVRNGHHCGECVTPCQKASTDVSANVFNPCQRSTSLPMEHGCCSRTSPMYENSNSSFCLSCVDVRNPQLSRNSHHIWNQAGGNVGVMIDNSVQNDYSNNYPILIRSAFAPDQFKFYFDNQSLETHSNHVSQDLKHTQQQRMFNQINNLNNLNMPQNKYPELYGKIPTKYMDEKLFGVQSDKQCNGNEEESTFIFNSCGGGGKIIQRKQIGRPQSPVIKVNFPMNNSNFECVPSNIPSAANHESFTINREELQHNLPNMLSPKVQSEEYDRKEFDEENNFSPILRRSQSSIDSTESNDVNFSSSPPVPTAFLGPEFDGKNSGFDLAEDVQPLIESPSQSFNEDYEWTSSNDLLNLVNNQCELNESDFYYGNVSTSEIHSLLTGTSTGTFIVRDSHSSSYLYSISFMTTTGPLCIRLGYEQGMFSLTSLDPERAHKEKTIVALIDKLISSSFHYLQQDDQSRWTRGFFTKPLKKQPSSLCHLARLSLNKINFDPNFTKCNIPDTIKKYLNDYTYSI